MYYKQWDKSKNTLSVLNEYKFLMQTLENKNYNCPNYLLWTSKCLDNLDKKTEAIRNNKSRGIAKNVCVWRHIARTIKLYFFISFIAIHKI